MRRCRYVVLSKYQEISLNQISNLQPCDEELPDIHDWDKHMAVTKSRCFILEVLFFLFSEVQTE